MDRLQNQLSGSTQFNFEWMNWIFFSELPQDFPARPGVRPADGVQDALSLSDRSAGGATRRFSLELHDFRTADEDMPPDFERPKSTCAN